MRKHPGERFGVELEALPDDTPAAVRLKQALKIFLRRFGLRCTYIGPPRDAAEKPPEGRAKDDDDRADAGGGDRP